MTRKIFLDTETTGISSKEHRIVEIAAVETLDGVKTGKVFHCLINPDRDVPAETVAVHGHTRESLADKPRFRDIAEKFIAFIRGAEVYAHNSPFDEDHLNAELVRMSYSESLWEIASFTDTLDLSRRIRPDLKKHSLDALLDEYGIDRSKRTVHTALLDTHLLVDWFAVFSSRHDLAVPTLETDVMREPIRFLSKDSHPSLKVVSASAEEARLHEGYLDGLQSENKSPPLARQASTRPVARL